MKKIAWLLAAFVLAACQPSEDEKAALLSRQIDSLYEHKDYLGTLNAIRRLRTDHPKALKARQKALKMWQEASLKMAQEDIGRTDSALQATIKAFEAETNIGRKNRLGVRRDSLQIRYDALCGTVRIIHKRQEQQPAPKAQE